MAQFIPSIEKIKQFRVQPTEGEWHLLRFLEQTLDNSYEVYFNPYLNGDRPDVVILRQGGGAYIIEAKDWDLNMYKLDERRHWKLKHPKDMGERNAVIKSPINQCHNYKDNLYNLHIENLLDLKIQKFTYFKVVSCAVYFHNASLQQINELLVVPFKKKTDAAGNPLSKKQKDKNWRYLRFLENEMDFIGRDSLNERDFTKLLKKHFMSPDTHTFLFSNSLYESFKHLLVPPRHTMEQGEHFSYSEKQKELIYDTQHRKEWRVKGVVGSGKTTLLAAKAIQCYKELVEQGISEPKILILTYNITLRNFIHDKLQKVNENFDWSSFTILNYHHFITLQLNNLGIPFEREDNEPKELFFARYYDNYSLFQEHEMDTERYDAIFIDEIQDYKRVWMDIIKDLFRKPEGCYYLFGDVKQNIYNRATYQRDVRTNVLGVHKLDSCFRADMKVRDLAVGFQNIYFNGKYDIDTLVAEEDAGSLFARDQLQQGYLNYIYLQGNDPVVALFNIVNGNINNRVKAIAENDIAILGQNIDFLKKFEAYYRYKTGKETTIMFENYYAMFLTTLRNLAKNSQTPHFISELVKLIQRDKDRKPDGGQEQMAQLFAEYEIFRLYPNEFRIRMEEACRKTRCTLDGFLNLLRNSREAFGKFRETVMTGDYDFIQENKKLHFWMNTGNIKISTIHSFKGWESEVVFLLLEPRKPGSISFDELLYTGITRTRSNLVVINLGNSEYHANMQRLIETYK